MNKISNIFKSGSSSSSGSGSSRSHPRKQGPSPQEALHRLRETEEMLTKKQEFLENRIQRELEIARRSGTKNKRDHLKFIHFLHTCRRNISKSFVFSGLLCDKMLRKPVILLSVRSSWHLTTPYLGFNVYRKHHIRMQFC
ncbi:charged multivesicular body protein 4c-like [Rhincodon typus]|uniref:charged multivesicular body protein 4c-like n=1 Tax=Rhincodon typus TaxID=259920 RepID=UPI00202EDAEF|nr:charged multivesicular body protein 4c-like [Rhincodon typus]